MKIVAKYELGDAVFIDGCHELRAAVTGVAVTSGRIQIECSWISNGVSQCAWIDEFRLEKAVA